MARQREFDEQLAVRHALEVFWSKGYCCASLSDILAATELSRSSFYETFGSKRDMVIQALHCYSRLLMAGPFAPLLEPGAGRPQIEAALRSVAARALEPEGQRGCFVNTCMSEITVHDAAVLRAAQAIKLQLENALADAVRRGQQAGAITRREDARAMARFLVNTLSGINLAAKGRPGEAALDDIVRVALRALD